MTGTRLGEVLVAAGLMAREGTEVRGAERTAAAGADLVVSLAADNELSEEEVARSIAEQLDLPYVDVAEIPPNREAIELLPRRLALRYEVLPLYVSDGTLTVAMTDPTDLVAIDDLRALIRIGRVAIRVAGPSAIREAQRRFYAAEAAAGEVLGRFGGDHEAAILSEEQSAATEDVGALEAAAHEGPIVTLVGAILSDAIRNRATDVHIEPRRDELCVRHRVDGLLRDSVTLPMSVHAGVTSRFKIISGMDITERRKPQDGRTRIAVDGETVDSRVSTIPTQHGEKVVVRLLRRLEQDLTMSGLGLTTEQEAILREHLEFPHGLVLFTGPTGAGKTSTMYAGLMHVQDPTANVVSLEDPIEYEIPGVSQIQISERGGVTFPSGLRSLLRQDPDVLMVGEIRDLETAQMVMRAAATGHLVLSSLHTNDAASATSRLVGLGLEPYEVAEALTLVVAQRLVRVLCTRCSVAGTPSEQTSTRMGLGPGALPTSVMLKGPGCEACGYTGYRGRRGIYELLPVAPRVRTQILKQSSELPTFGGDIVAGSLRQNGLRLAAEGLTSLEEVMRVTQVEVARRTACHSCGKPTEPGSSACPHCRSGLGAGACRKCGGSLEVGWKVCPFCAGAPRPVADRPRAVVRLPDA